MVRVSIIEVQKNPDVEEWISVILKMMENNIQQENVCDSD